MKAFITKTRTRMLVGGFVILFFSIVNNGYANVLIQGSRIIYNQKTRSVDVRLTNPDTIPYVVQNWFDSGDLNSKPQDKNNAPFISTPPVFKIDPKSDQIIRVMATDISSLPKDRESVFGFNVLEVPPSNLAEQSNQNAVLLIIKSRIKLFFRPAGIGTPGRDLIDKLKVKWVKSGNGKSGIEISNPTPWHVSLSSVEMGHGAAKKRLKATMIAPYDVEVLPVENKVSGSSPLTIKIKLINDQGGDVERVFNIDK